MKKYLVRIKRYKIIITLIILLVTINYQLNRTGNSSQNLYRRLKYYVSRFNEPIKYHIDINMIIPVPTNHQIGSFQYNIRNFLAPNSLKPEKLIKILRYPAISNRADDFLLLLAIVVIKPEHFERRDVIRHTWKAKRYQSSFKVVFFMGTSKRADVNRKIADESQRFDDIVQIQFEDSYYSLTEKVMQAFKWAINSYDKLGFIMRINDDVVVNTSILVKYLMNVWDIQNNIDSVDLSRLIIGNVWTKTYRMRDSANKFYVPFNYYKEDQYFPYCEGSAYVITPKLARDLLQGYSQLDWPPYTTWLEDVLVGMLSINVSSHFINIDWAFSSKIQQDKLQLNKVAYLNKTSLMFVYIQKTHEIRQVWKLINS